MLIVNCECSYRKTGFTVYWLATMLGTTASKDISLDFSQRTLQFHSCHNIQTLETAEVPRLFKASRSSSQPLLPPKWTMHGHHATQTSENKELPQNNEETSWNPGTKGINNIIIIIVMKVSQVSWCFFDMTVKIWLKWLNEHSPKWYLRAIGSSIIGSFPAFIRSFNLKTNLRRRWQNMIKSCSQNWLRNLSPSQTCSRHPRRSYPSCASCDASETYCHILPWVGKSKDWHLLWLAPKLVSGKHILRKKQKKHTDSAIFPTYL